ncbi:hypothetical protein FOA52_013143 [Chlamydomonas sp. UWO 241]|nr:hypothetical protein FOA52_013143 [Chlamydomonas sp. UWO 241]
MERRTLPKVASLIFDLEMEDGAAVVHNTDDIEIDLVESELRTFLRPGSSEHAKLIADVADAVAAQTQASSSSAEQQALHQPVDAVSLLSALTSEACGYRVRLIRAVGGGEGSACLHNLRHTFLVVTPPEHGAGHFIVDAHFVEQFEIAKPTPRYTRILSCVPRVLVLPEERVPPLVTFLCAELAGAFKTLGTVVPPWRQAASMLTKWLPRRSLDVELSSGSAARTLRGTGGPHANGVPSIAAVGRAATRSTPLDDAASGAPDGSGGDAAPGQHRTRRASIDMLGAQLAQLDEKGELDLSVVSRNGRNVGAGGRGSGAGKPQAVVPLALEPNKVMGGFHGGYLHVDSHMPVTIDAPDRRVSTILTCMRV